LLGPGLHSRKRKAAIEQSVPYLGEELPGPADGLLLEVVPEGPVPEHLEKGVVVGVLPHVIEVVVLPAGADALLGIAGTAQPAERRVRGRRSEEDRLELVHSGVGEQQRGIVDGDRGARRPPRVRLGHEEVDERLAGPPGRPIRRRRRHRIGGGGCGGEGQVVVDCSGGGQNPSLRVEGGEAEQAARA